VANIERLVACSRDGYDRRRHEKETNQLPTFTLPVAVLEGIRRSRHAFSASCARCDPAVVRARLAGHFLEVEKLLPLLVDAESEGGPNPRVVASSLLGFGFSVFVDKTGFALDQHAEIRTSPFLCNSYSWGHVCRCAMTLCVRSDTSAMVHPSNRPTGLVYLNLVVTQSGDWANYVWIAG
jgi:hypothetical protein